MIKKPHNLRFEDGIPLTTTRQGPSHFYARLLEMQVGQSVLLPVEKNGNGVKGRLQQLAKERKYAVRSTPSGDRIWRLS